MDPLDLLAAAALSRLVSAPPPRPQLLACHEGRALLRTPGGIQRVPLDEAAFYDLSPLIDHTLLKAEATAAQVEQLCAEAREHGFASVCVNPAFVARAAAWLASSPVRVCTVVGFPLGATTGAQKAREAEEALAQGASEVDLVLAIGAAKDGDWAAVEEEFRLLRRAVPRPAVLKVILETCLLEDEEKRRACGLALEAGLDFVKTSTGFSTGGATEADVALMRAAVGLGLGVKASGGVRDYAGALRMVRAGATRLGLSASLAVVGAGSISGTGY